MKLCEKTICLFLVVFLLTFVLSPIHLKAKSPTSPKVKEETSPPTIVISPDIYYPLDEVLYIEGRSIPRVNNEIQFSKQGSKPRAFFSKADPNGEWVFAEKVPLEAGDWEVRARALEDKEKVSAWSNPRVFKVIVSGITVGGVNIKFAVLSLLIVILIITGIALTLYFSWRVRRLKSTIVAKEIREAHEATREGVANLRKEILDELRLLETSGKPLSAEELARKEHLIKELEMLEKNVEREIRDIEEKV